LAIDFQVRLFVFLRYFFRFKLGVCNIEAVFWETNLDGILKEIFKIHFIKLSVGFY